MRAISFPSSVELPVRWRQAGLILPCLALLAISSARADDAAPPDPGPIPLPAPTLTVKFNPALKGVHPRLFFDAKGLEALRQKVKDPRVAPLLDAFLAGAAKTAAQTPPSPLKQTEDPVRSYGDRLPETALAYLLTGDKKYLESTKQWLDALTGAPTWAGDTDLGAGHVAFGMALTYDWLYDTLSSEERQRIETALLQHCRRLMARATPMTQKKGWGWSYFQNHCWVNHLGIAAAAMATYETNPAELQGWLDYTRDHFEVTYRNLGIDGGNYEGPAYANYGTQRLLYYAQILRDVSGDDLFGVAYFQGVGLYAVHCMMPDWKDVANFGDSGPDGRGRIDDEIPIKLASVNHDGRLLTFLQNLHAATPKANAPSPFSLIWYDLAVEPKPLDDLPPVGLYPDLGLVICRTGWDENAAVVAFHCGAPGGQHLAADWSTFPGGAAAFSHVHADAGSFLFWADHHWRIGAPGAYTHFKATHNENVWMAGGLGQQGEAKWFNATPYLDKSAQAHLVTVAATPQADYLVGEAGPAYDPAAGVKSFRRHLLLVKGPKPYVVVYDKLTADKPQSWTSCLHTFTEAQTDGATGFQVAEPATFGTFLGPGKLTTAVAPLTVITHPDDKKEQRGFELAVSPEGTSDSTWLVTVVGIEKKSVTLTGSDPAPHLTVGTDEIAWDADDQVTLNKTPISGNLLPAAAR